MTDDAELRQLALTLQRDLLAQGQLRALLSVADGRVTENRRELRNLKARIARRPPERGRTE